MKLNFKDLKQQSFSVEAEPTDTIATVKSKVAEAKGLDASQMRLIFSGKILADDNTVESYNVEQMLKGYIVCMVQKPKQPAATSSKPPSTPAAPIVAQTPSAPAPATPAPAPAAAVPSTPTPASATTATTAPGSRQFNDPAPLMLGERQAALANMEAMGFPRADCERALRAAFFNPDRAVEYLLTGIPASAEQQPPAPSAQAPAASAPAQTTTTTSATPAATADADEPVNLFDIAAAANQGGRTGGAARGAAGGQDALAGMGGEGENLDFLRDNATFQHLRQLVQQQPAMLENVLQQVGASNPQLAQMIASNPQQFLQLLSESDDGEGAPMPPGAQNISVTPEERDAIERLCRLGFERDLVIQAYFACDKNEELAANFLFDHPDDLDDQ